jgi:hypothetical protein
MRRQPVISCVAEPIAGEQTIKVTGKTLTRYPRSLLRPLGKQ